MNKISKKVLVWEIFSALFVIITGSALHFVFAASGYNNIVATFSAVNESTWEHTKLAFFPIILFSLLQYPFVRKEFKNYFSVKAKEAFLAVFLIIAIFYTYSGVMGQHYLFMDIATFVLAVVFAKVIAYIHIYNRARESQIIPIILIGLLGAFFVYATFFPPRIQLFKDSPTGNYGIVRGEADGVFCTMDAKLCPDGSYVGRIPPDCEFAACPEFDDTTMSAEIRKLFVDKYPQFSDSIIIKIEIGTKEHARGGITFVEGQPGGIFLVARIDGDWKILHEGNGQISCDLAEYGFPVEMLLDCSI